MLWRIQGRYDRHKRVFTVQAPYYNAAKDEALTMIRSVYSQSSGEFTRLVWKFGRVVMIDQYGTDYEIQAQRPHLYLIR
jgi:hypothetical protein